MTKLRATRAQVIAAAVIAALALICRKGSLKPAR